MLVGVVHIRECRAIVSGDEGSSDCFIPEVSKPLDGMFYVDPETYRRCFDKDLPKPLARLRSSPHGRLGAGRSPPTARTRHARQSPVHARLALVGGGVVVRRVAAATRATAHEVPATTLTHHPM
jgi:hypothetical protein